LSLSGQFFIIQNFEFFFTISTQIKGCFWKFCSWKSDRKKQKTSKVLAQKVRHRVINKFQKTHALKSALDTKLNELAHVIEKQEKYQMILSHDKAEKLRKLKEYELIHLFYNRLI
jgi:ribosome-binding protein aMBF1 (putative translation factor)